MRILVFFISCLSATCFAQTSFYRLYSGSGNDKGEDVVQLEDSSFVIVGSSSSWDDNQAAFMLHVDSLGNYLSSHAYGGAEVDGGKRVLYKPGSGFFIIGQSNSYSIAADYDFYFVKTDLNGTLITERTISHPGWDRVHDAIWSKDSTLLVVGETLPNQGESNMFLAMLNQNGDSLWTKEMGGIGPDKASSVIRVEDSLYLVGGELFMADSGFVKGIVMKINNQGQIVWQDTINEIIGESGITELALAPTFYYGMGYSKKSAEDYDPFFGRFNWDGSYIAGYVQVENNSSKIPNEMVYIAAGNRMALAMPKYDFAHPTRVYDMLLANFEANDMYWLDQSVSIEYEQMEYIGQVITTSDNSTVFLGSSDCQWVCETSFNGGGHIFLMKVGNHNQFPQTNQYTTINDIRQLVTISEHTTESMELYPNPADDYLVVELANSMNCLILSQDGRLIDSRFVPSGKSELKLDLLSSGLYWFQFNNEKVTHTVKVIVK